MAGGLLAAHREYFFEIGGYGRTTQSCISVSSSARSRRRHGSVGWRKSRDVVPSMDVWRYSGVRAMLPRWPHLPARSPLQHARIERYRCVVLAPSSDIYPIGKGDVHGRNSLRLAEVWMDDYKRLYYLHRPDLRVNSSMAWNRKFQSRDACLLRRAKILAMSKLVEPFELAFNVTRSDGTFEMFSPRSSSWMKTFVPTEK